MTKKGIIPRTNEGRGPCQKLRGADLWHTLAADIRLHSDHELL